MATTDSFFALIGAHPVWHSRWVNERGKPAFQKPLTAEKQSIKRQLYTTCGSCWLGTAQQFHHDMRGEGGSQITSKSKQGAHIHQPTASLLPHACAQPHHAGGQPWAAVSPILGLNSMVWPLVSDQGNLCKKTLSCRSESFKRQFHTTHVGAVGPGNCTAALPRHAWGRQITGLVYVCPLL